MLIAFFDAEGLVYHEFLPQRQTMNQTVYITVLQRLRDAVRRKRPHKWSSGTWLLHHDNAPCHAALSVREFLAKHSVPVVPPPALRTRFGSLRLLPLPQTEEHPKGETISRRRGDITKYDTAVRAIPKQTYQTCIEKWKDRWNRCIRALGSYFEGDNFE
jgi:hypothetical protein